MFKVNKKDSKGNVNEHLVLLFVLMTLNRQVPGGRLSETAYPTNKYVSANIRNADGVFIVNFEHVSYLSLDFLLLTLKYIFVCRVVKKI